MGRRGPVTQRCRSTGRQDGGHPLSANGEAGVTNGEDSGIDGRELKGFEPAFQQPFGYARRQELLSADHAVLRIGQVQDQSRESRRGFSWHLPLRAPACPEKLEGVPFQATKINESHEFARTEGFCVGSASSFMPNPTQKRRGGPDQGARIRVDRGLVVPAGSGHQYPLLMRRSEQRRDAVFACYQQDVTDRPLSILLAEARPFTKELAEGVEQHREELDEVIAEYAKGWDLNRIAPLEKNIMRVALYEMNYREDVPFEVAIDEAVETAKKYSGAEAPGFVNGILGAVAKTMQADIA